MTLSEELKSKREELGYTQRQMANYLDISYSTYQNLEIYGGSYGDRSMPGKTTVQKLRKKGITDYTYADIVQTIRRDRAVRNRHRKGNRKDKQEQ